MTRPCCHLLALTCSVQNKIGGFLRLGRRAENRTFVLLERFQPAFNVGGALVEFRRDANPGTKKTSANFCDQLFKGIGLTVCKLLDPLQPLFATGPMDLMPTSA